MRPRLPIGEMGKVNLKRGADKQGVSHWTAECSLRIPTGEKKRVTARGATQAKAMAGLEQKVADHRRAGVISGSRLVKVSDAVDYYINNLVTVDTLVPVRDTTAIRTQTLAQYKNDARILADAFKNVMLWELNVPIAQRILIGLMDVKTGSGYRRAAQAQGTLKRAIDEAVRLGYVTSNPVKFVKLPRPGVRIVEAPTVEDINTVRALLVELYSKKRPGPQRSKHGIHAIELMLSTGCRVGEIMALRWQDVNIQRKTLTVAGTIIEKGAMLRQAYTKTELRHRTYSLTDRAVAALIEAREACGRRIDDESPVFPTRTGKFTTPSAVRRTLRDALGDSELPVHITPHAFRRAVATLLAENIGIEAASIQLGHKDSRTTVQHYISRAQNVKDRTNILSQFG